MAQARIFDSDRTLLQNLSASTGKQQQEIIHEALAEFHRNRMLDELNTAFAAVKRDVTAWRDEQAERMVWDGASADGMTVE